MQKTEAPASVNVPEEEPALEQEEPVEEAAPLAIVEEAPPPSDSAAEEVDETPPPEYRVASYDMEALKGRLGFGVTARPISEAFGVVGETASTPTPPPSSAPEGDSDDESMEEDEGFRAPFPRPLSTPAVSLPVAAPVPEADERHPVEKIRSLDDMMARFPLLGEGDHFIRVERRQPRRYQGVYIEGLHRPVVKKMTEQEFSALYGQGTYTLTMYGPTKRKRYDDNGRPAVQALTEPIILRVPEAYGNNPPNLELAGIGISEEDEFDGAQEGTMESILRRRVGVPATTEADATVRQAELEHELRSKEQDFEQRRQLRIEESEAEDRRRRIQEETEARYKRELRERDEQVEALRKRPMEESASMLTGLASVLQAVSPRGDSSSGEVERLRDEVHRLRDQHRSEMDLVHRASEEALRRERDRSDDSIRRAEENARARIEEVERNARDRVEEIRRSSDSALQSMNMQWQARLDDERRQHDRDRSNLSSQGDMQTSTIKTTMEMQLHVREAEIVRLQGEKSEIARELAAEKAKSLVERIREARETAEELGFTDGGGEEEGGGWKDVLAGFAQRAPELLGTLAMTLKPQPAPALHQRQPVAGVHGHPPQQQTFRRAFATEDMDLPRGEHAFVNPPPVMVPTAAGRDIVTTGHESFTSALPPEPLPPQAPSAPPEGFAIQSEHVAQLATQLRADYEADMEPEQVAERFMEGVPKSVLQSIMNSITLQSVIEILEQHDENEEDPLLRPAGREFLGGVFKTIKERVG